MDKNQFVEKMKKDLEFAENVSENEVEVKKDCKRKPEVRDIPDGEWSKEKDLRRRVYLALIEACNKENLVRTNEQGKVALYKDGFLVFFGDDALMVKVTQKKALPDKDKLIAYV